jgi:hypothetical protein
MILYSTEINIDMQKLRIAKTILKRKNKVESSYSTTYEDV